MKFDVVVVAIPRNDKTKKYLLNKKALSTTMGDELISEFEDSYLEIEKNLLKVQKILSRDLQTDD